MVAQERQGRELCHQYALCNRVFEVSTCFYWALWEVTHDHSFLLLKHMVIMLNIVASDRLRICMGITITIKTLLLFPSNLPSYRLNRAKIEILKILHYFWYVATVYFR
jgi:hypothetical protein